MNKIEYIKLLQGIHFFGFMSIVGETVLLCYWLNMTGLKTLLTLRGIIFLVIYSIILLNWNNYMQARIKAVQ